MIQYNPEKTEFTVQIQNNFRENTKVLKEIFLAGFRKWDNEEKIWRIPIHFKMEENFQNLSRRTGIQITPYALEKMGQIQDYWKQMEDMSWRVKPSKSPEDGDPMKQLFPFQLAGQEYFNMARESIFLADPMGLGKTIQFIFYLFSQSNKLGKDKVFPCLILCPASLKYNWQKEFNKWLKPHMPELTMSIVKDGSHQFDVSDVVICNYELCYKDTIWEQLIEIPFNSVGCDESHMLKSHKSKRSKAVVKLVTEELEPRIRFCITGTPEPNGKPEENIQPLRILDMLNFFGGLTQYMIDYCGVYHKPAIYENGRKVKDAVYLDGGEVSDERKEELGKKLRACGMRRCNKFEALPDLPPMTVDVIPVEITTRAEYQEALDDLREYLRGKYYFKLLEEGLDPDTADTSARRRVISSMLAENAVRIENLRQISARGKISFVKEFIKNLIEDGEKVCIFSHHIDVQKAFLKIKKGCCRILGEDSDKKRQENVERFQNGTNPEDMILVGSIKAGGVGVTLTASRFMIVVEDTWVAGDRQQLYDRLHRISQDRPVTIYKVIGIDTVDEMIHRYIDEKEYSAFCTLDSGSNAGENILAELMG